MVKIIFIGFLVLHQSNIIAQNLQPVSSPEQDLTETPVMVDENEPSVEAQTEQIDWDSNSEASKTNYDQINIRDIVEPDVDYRYAAFDVPDPFVPPVVTPPAERKEADAVVALSQFQLSTLKVVGIWETSPGVRKAFVKAGEVGNGVTIVVGDSIGSEGGEVVNIETDHIRVREFRLSEDGTRQFRDTIKRLGDASSGVFENSNAGSGDDDDDDDPVEPIAQAPGLVNEAESNLVNPIQNQNTIQGNQLPTVEPQGQQAPEVPAEVPSNSGGIISI